MYDIKTFKLTSGEEIVAKVKDETETEIVLDDVLLVMGQQTQQGLQVGLMPFMFSNPEGTLTLTRGVIMVESQPSSGLEKGYIERTSNVAIATSI